MSIPAMLGDEAERSGESVTADGFGWRLPVEIFAASESTGQRRRAWLRKRGFEPRRSRP
jgi:hypothetical protein